MVDSNFELEYDDPSSDRLSDSSKNRPIEKDESSTIVFRETEQLRRFRLFLALVLSCVALGLALAVYFLVAGSEEDQFVSNYEDRANLVKDVLHRRIQQKIAIFESLSFAITSYAMHTNVMWPFIVIPDYALKAAGVRTLAESVAVVFYPYVTDKHRSDWETFSAENLEWIDQGLQYEELFEKDRGRILEGDKSAKESATEPITQVNGDGERIIAPEGSNFYLPAWHSSPVASDLVNLDLLSSEFFAQGVEGVLETNGAVIGKSFHGDLSDDTLEYKKLWEQNNSYDTDGPIGKFNTPVFEELDPNKRVAVGFVTSVFFWESFFRGVLPAGQDHVDIVIVNDCDQEYTFSVHDGEVTYTGVGDHHDSKFDPLRITDLFFHDPEVQASLEKRHGIPFTELCEYELHIYPTTALEDQYKGATPWIFFALVLCIFAFTIFVIYCYDRRIEQNYEIVYKKAKQAGAIVSSIFPDAVRQRLYEDERNSTTESQSQSQSKDVGTGAFKQKAPSAVDAQKIKLKGFLSELHIAGSEQPPTESHVRPGKDSHLPSFQKKEAMSMADSYPAVTILFADIVGFTPWSSQREPAEIFTLLQTLFHELDHTARVMQVFKVETVGDCYVAATGLPEPQHDHAVRMARFAAKCMMSIVEVTKQLEVKLGPDTGELRMRIGLNSGPVMAGVLKGAKTRFQLFGDTMNMAARMESNSRPNRIQCSESTADLLRKDGKEHWITPREDKVEAKGKGVVQTYWLLPKSGGPSVASGDDDYLPLASKTASDDNAEVDEVPSPTGIEDPFIKALATPGHRFQRLIDWNVDVLAGLLKQIQAKRLEQQAIRKSSRKSKHETPTIILEGGTSARDEVTETIELPKYSDVSKAKKKVSPEDIDLGSEVMSQLQDYVTTIASMYHDNAFHNFEHASHVTMSTNKLLKRVVVKDADGDGRALIGNDLHAYTYGITSDPLTQFALVFCSLIHDVDHPGVSNFQLIQENATLAKLYQNKSVAEQNSVDLAWDLLMDPNYEELRQAIYADQDDLRRFRQLVVNIVLATDIFDADMKAIRDQRWGKAFQYDNEGEGEAIEEASLPSKAIDRDFKSPLANIESTNLKATIVMEHLIQASDVAHTMQHWEIFLKWNERLFNEMYTAFQSGRALKDPSLSWYEGEIMFFDKYIIPLAKKLDDCGVFGVASDECLNYANQNRKKWAIEGDRLVEGYLEKYHAKRGILRKS